MRSATTFLELLMLSMIAACDQSAPEQPATGVGAAPASNTQAPGSMPTASSHGGQPAAPQTTRQPPPSTTGSSSGGAPGASSSGGAPASTGASGSGARATMSGGSPSGGASAASGNGGAGGAGATAGMPSGGGSSTPPAATSRIYATMYADNEITVIDGDTYAILDHIPVGRGPAILFETPDHSKLYTANWADNSISSVSFRRVRWSRFPKAGSRSSRRSARTASSFIRA